MLFNRNARNPQQTASADSQTIVQFFSPESCMDILISQKQNRAKVIVCYLWAYNEKAYAMFHLLWLSSIMVFDEASCHHELPYGQVDVASNWRRPWVNTQWRTEAFHSTVHKELNPANNYKVNLEMDVKSAHKMPVSLALISISASGNTLSHWEILSSLGK